MTSKLHIIDLNVLLGFLVLLIITIILVTRNDCLETKLHLAANFGGITGSHVLKIYLIDSCLGSQWRLILLLDLFVMSNKFE